MGGAGKAEVTSIEGQCRVVAGYGHEKYFGGQTVFRHRIYFSRN